jgi:hypothetical protein
MIHDQISDIVLDLIYQSRDDANDFRDRGTSFLVHGGFLIVGVPKGDPTRTSVSTALWLKTSVDGALRKDLQSRQSRLILSWIT